MLDPHPSTGSDLLPPPTLADVPYGSHPRQVLDFWKTRSSAPAPLLFYIHGGGWLSNDKRKIEIPEGISRILDAGISVVSINYRYIHQKILSEDPSTPRVELPNPDVDAEPPVAVPLGDAVRALQFVRHHAAEWAIDPERIAASGSSAGACTALWLGFRRDLANPAADDPVGRESPRLACIAAMNAQTSLDPQQMIEWTPNSRYGGHAFGFAWNPNDITEEFRAFLAQRERVLPWIEAYSPYALVTDGMPPVYLLYTQDTPGLGENRPDPTHTANFGVKLQERLRQFNGSCELVYNGAPEVSHPTISDFLITQLRALRDSKL